MRRVLLITAVAGLAAVAVAFTTAGSSASGRTVTTNGHGVVTVVPDQATIDAGVRTTGATAAAALAANGDAMTRVIAALKRAGATKIQTQEVSLYPQTGPRGKVTGFVAQNTVTATSPLAQAGRLIDAAVGAGANTIDGPTLGVSIQNRLYRQALRNAVADARAKALALAGSVGRVLTISEQSQQQPITFGAAAKTPSATPVEAGTQQVTADVQVTFALR
jgi:uncharacterized protein